MAARKKSREEMMRSEIKTGRRVAIDAIAIRSMYCGNREYSEAFDDRQHLDVRNMSMEAARTDATR